MSNIGIINPENGNLIPQDYTFPKSGRKSDAVFAHRKIVPRKGQDLDAHLNMRASLPNPKPHTDKPLAQRSISQNWTIMDDEPLKGKRLSPEESVRALLGAEAIDGRDMEKLIRIRQSFSDFARRLANPKTFSYRVADAFRDLLQQLPSTAEKRDQAFRLLCGMIEADANSVRGGRLLRAIADRQDFKDLHLSLVSFIPALTRLRSARNSLAPSEATLQRLNGVRDLLDRIVRRVGKNPPNAVKPARVSYQERSDFLKIFGSTRTAVTQVLPQPKARALGSLKGQEQLPTGPKSVSETRRLLLTCLDDYKTHEDSFDPYDVHGRTHATRTFIFANVLGNILREKGLRVDVNAVAMMAAGHDSGREANQQDVFEEKSANLTRRHIRETFGPNAGPNTYIDEVADAISTDESNARTVEAYLLHCADSLDFWRVAPVEMESFPFLREAVAGEDEQGRPVTVKIDSSLREALVRESHELMKLTHAFAVLDREADAIREKDAYTEEDQARLQEIAEMQEDGSEWLRTVWKPRMNRSNEEVVASIEQAIRDNPEKFPLLRKHYLNHIPDEALNTIHAGLVTEDGTVDIAHVRSGIEALRSLTKDLRHTYQARGLKDDPTHNRFALTEKCDNIQGERMTNFVRTLSNEDLTVMYQALLGHDVEALKSELAQTGDTDALGLLDDFEAAVVSAVAKRCDASEKDSVDEGLDLQTSSMATLVEMTSDAYLRAAEAKRIYDQKMGQVFKKPIDIHRIGDILRNRELTINFNPLYLFGDLRRWTVGQPFPIDTGDHIYKNLFKVHEDGVPVDPGVLIFRQRVEDLRFPKIGDNNLSGKARPTYSAINGVGPQGAASQYGHTVFVLKPKCKRHATYTYGETDYQIPLKIVSERNEKRFIQQLLNRAEELCQKANQRTVEDFVQAMDTPDSPERQAIHQFFTDPQHAANPNYTRLEFYEFEMPFESKIPDWEGMVAALGLQIASTDNTLLTCLMDSCADLDRLAGKHVDFDHLDNLVADMKDYDDVRMNLSATRNGGKNFVLEGVGFIEAQLHQQIDVYNDVAEIRFSSSDLPNPSSPNYEPLVAALKDWGNAHGVKITIGTREAERRDNAPYYELEQRINEVIEDDLADRTSPIKIEKINL